MRVLRAYDLGRQRYADTHALQARLQRARQLDCIEDVVLTVEHHPVVTLGRGAKRENLLLDESALLARGIDVEETGRGGDVTYHGPGQLVVYPIVALAPDRKDVRRYVYDLEESMIRTLADWGLSAQRIAGLNGAWLRAPDEKNDRKIGAVGVRISRWVTMHGLALNVNTDLDAFAVIVPCGVRNKTVTSLRTELSQVQDVDRVRAALLGHLADTLGRTLERCEGAPTVPAVSGDTSGFG